jgi:hypothetical protein
VAPRRFAVPSAEFDIAAFCGLLDSSGRGTSSSPATRGSIASGGSNKGLVLAQLFCSLRAFNADVIAVEDAPT